MFIVLFLLPFGLALDPYLLSDEYIDHLNNNQDLWTAGRNFAEDTPVEHLPSLFGTILSGTRGDFPTKTYDADFIASLPESFDGRDQWPNCPSLKEIRDQGACGSCWAFGAVSAMTDRWCIHQGSQFHFSAQDMAGCENRSLGCGGGYVDAAWSFWNENGVVSGGNYNSNQGCKPYEIPECIHGTNCSAYYEVKCVEECRSGYNTSYKNDKRFGQDPYGASGEDNIKAEVYKNGPVEVGFTACPDLYHYKKGVYKHISTPNEVCGGHAVKILGWGVENGAKYWIIANSWNTHWGELGGFMKFLRGENHMDIEDGVSAALPKSP